MAENIVEIAEGLTKGRRGAILATNPGAVRRFSEVHGMVRVPLFSMGIFEDASARGYDPRFRLTPLGEQVRTHLQKDPG